MGGAIRRFGIALLLAGLAAASAGAAAVGPRFERIAADQLPREVVASLAQDREGFLWVGTGDGLARYDGLRLQPQLLDDAPTAAAGNLGWIRALLAARDGRVWIGTETRGLAVWEPANERLRLVQPGAPVQPTIMALTEGPDGSVWSGGQSGGLTRHAGDGRPLQQWLADGRPGSLPDDRVSALLVDREGVLWVGSWAGLARLREGHFEPVGQALAGQHVRALLHARDGSLWAGSGEGRLLRLRPDGQAELLPAGGTGAITALAETADGRLWVGGEQGIELRDAASGALQQLLRHRPLQPDGLAGNSITALLTDAGGVLWVGGLGLGLQRHDPAPRALRVVAAEPDPASPLARANVQALLARRNGEVWAATDDGPIAVLDAHLAVLRRGPRPAARVDAMAEQVDSRVWLGMPGLVQLLDADARPVAALRHGGGGTRRLLPGRDGRLWVAATDGLWRLDRQAAALQRVPRSDGQALAGEVHALAEDADGTVWVGSSQGLLRLPAGAQAAEPVASVPGAGLGNPVVLGLLIDREGRLWLDTAVSGLHRLSGWQDGRARFERISERHGAVGKPFGVNLMADDRGRIWTQMNVYEPATDRLTPLTAADGVRIGMPWFFSYSRTPDGRLLYGGTRGILEVTPAAWQPEQARPLLRLSGLTVDGRRVPVQSALQGLRLPPDTLRVQADVGLLGVAHAERLRYEYRVDGLDDDWLQSLPGQRQISLLQLAPGSYRLMLRAAPDAPELVLPLQVAAAWWHTHWVWVGGCLLLLAGFAVALRWRTRHLLARQQELEQRVRERTLALEEASLTDPLTGLRNRRSLQEHIEADCLSAARRVGSPEADLVFFLIDLDRFKQLNDSHGHAAGDAVLRQVRGRLAQVFRASDALVRWGGEEFLVVARDTDRRHAATLAERVRRAMADQPFDTPAGPLPVTASIGFVAYPPLRTAPQALSWQETLMLADAGLYEVKRSGRNGWRGLAHLDDQDAEQVRTALARGEAVGHWQQGPASAA